MGYRSSVEIVVYGEPETFDAFMSGMKLANHQVFTDWVSWQESTDYPMFEYHVVKTGHDSEVKLMHFRIDEVKWYDGYDAIDAWEKDFLPKAVDVGLNWEFARNGEDPSDVVYHYGGEDIQNFIYTETFINRTF
jgi:hypothetical protein